MKTLQQVQQQNHKERQVYKQQIQSLKGHVMTLEKQLIEIKRAERLKQQMVGEFGDQRVHHTEHADGQYEDFYVYNQNSGRDATQNMNLNRHKLQIEISDSNNNIIQDGDINMPGQILMKVGGTISPIMHEKDQKDLISREDKRLINQLNHGNQDEEQ